MRIKDCYYLLLKNSNGYAFYFYVYISININKYIYLYEFIMIVYTEYRKQQEATLGLKG